ncbi:hypothetical protein C8R46DRAFT_1023642 [Mycena filopes]|nr:hypothetical protein C8R46DRAFT_1023642 [Mycena filopes]
MEPENLPSPPPPDPASSKRPREPDADTESPNKVFVRHAFTGEAKLEIDRLEQENRALEEQLGHAKEAVDFLHTKVNEVCHSSPPQTVPVEVLKAVTAVAGWEAQCNDMSEELTSAELEKARAELEEERAELNDELRAAQAKIAASIAVQSALADARNELSHKALEIDSLKNVLQQNSTEITSLKKDREALQQARLREPDQSTTTAWQKDRAGLQQAQMELAKKSTSISELSHKVQMAEQLIRRLYKQQNEMDCTIKSTQAELSQAQRDREHPSTSGGASQQQPTPSHDGVGLNAGHSSNSGGFGGVPAPSVFGGRGATSSSTSFAPSPSTSGSANQQQPIPSHHGVGFNAGQSSNSGGFGGVPAPSVFGGHGATPSTTSFAPSPSTSGSANQQQPIPSHHGVGFNAGQSSNSGGFGGVPAPSVFGGHGATPSTTSFAPSPSTSGSANQQQPIPSHHGVGFNAGHSSRSGGFGGVPAPSVFGGHSATPSTTSSAPSPSTSGSANQQQPIPSHHGVGFNAGHSSNSGGFGGVPAPSFPGFSATPSWTSFAPSPSTSGSANQQQPIPSHHGVGFNAGHASNSGGFGGVPAPSVFGGRGATSSSTSFAPSPSTSGSANQQQPIPSHHGVGFNAGQSSNSGGFGGVPAPSVFGGHGATPSTTSFAPSPSTSGSANQQQQPIPSHHGAGFNAGHSSNSGGFGGVPAPSFPGFSASSATPSSTPSAPSPSMSSTSGSGNGSRGPPSTSAPEWAPGRPSAEPEQPQISKQRVKRNAKAQPANNFQTAFRNFVQKQLGMTRDYDEYRPVTSEQLATFNNGAGGPQIGQTPYALLINTGPAENAWNTAVGTLVISEYIKEHRHHYIDLTAERLRMLWNTRMTSVRKSHLELSNAPDPAAFLTKKQQGSRRISSRGTLLARRKATGLSKHLAPAVQTDLAVVFKALTGECMSSDDEGQGGNKRTKETTVVRKDYRHCNLINLMKWLDYFATHHGLNASGASTGRGVHPRLRLPGATSLGRKITGGLPVNFYNAAYLSSLSEFDRQKLDTKPAIFLPMYVLGWPSNNEFTHDPNDQDEYWRPQRRE